MTKTIYITPSVKVTDIVMVQTLCVSGGPGSSISGPTPGAITDEQL